MWKTVHERRATVFDYSHFYLRFAFYLLTPALTCLRLPVRCSSRPTVQMLHYAGLKWRFTLHDIRHTRNKRRIRFEVSLFVFPALSGFFFLKYLSATFVLLSYVLFLHNNLLFLQPHCCLNILLPRMALEQVRSPGILPYSAIHLIYDKGHLKPVQKQ